MKVTPVTGPGAINAHQESDAQRTARLTEKFTQILTKQGQPPQQQEHPVPNANQVAVEDLSAIQQSKPSLSDNKTAVSAEITEDTETQQTVKDPESERRFVQIARQERALRAKAQQQDKTFKEREAALQAREAALAPQDLSNYVSKDQIRQDALSVLEENGVSWDALTDQVVNRQPTDPRVNSHISRLEAKILELEKANVTSRQSQEQQQQASYQAAVKQIRTDATNLVNSDPEFETVKAKGAVKDVVELIERTYAKDGVVLSVEEAAKEVEEYLVNEAVKDYNINKIKQRIAASNASKTTSETKTQSPQQTQMKTLTNATSSTRPLTSRERAIMAAEGRLKP